MQHRLKPCRAVTTLCTALLLCTGLSACNVAGYVAYSMQQDVPKEVKARYTGLENERVAIMVQSSSFVYSMSPHGPDKVGYGMGAKMQASIEGVTVIPKDIVDTYKRKNRGWIAYEPARIMEDLGVNRVVLVDLYEYRTHEPGDPHVKMGIMAANISVLSLDEYDPNTIAFSTDVRTQWPKDTKVGAVTLDDNKVEQVTLNYFLREAAGLFYDYTYTPSQDQ